MAEPVIGDVAKIVKRKKSLKELAQVKEAVTKKNHVKEQQGHKCVYCGCTNKLMLTIDHKIPKVRGGPDEESNMQVCCWACNILKGPLNDEEFRKYLIALEILYDLCKVRISLPDKLPVYFNQDHYPDFPPNNIRKVWIPDAKPPNPFGEQYK